MADPSALGFGLSGMRERVRAQSGTLVIEPAQPGGTVLLVSLPVRTESARTEGASQLK
jgi:two-component system sensor histidine kinase UhpB